MVRLAAPAPAFVTRPSSPAAAALADLVARLRPDADAAADAGIRAEIARLRTAPDEAARLGGHLQTLLALPRQTALYAETGVRSALGFWLELMQRASHRLLPPTPDDTRLADVLRRVLTRPDDWHWIAAVDDAAWCELAAALGLAGDAAADGGAAGANLLEAVRVLSYRLAGAALDRELLRADPALERHESPFLAQNAALLPLLERARDGGAGPSVDEIRVVDVLLDQCMEATARVRRQAREAGISIRLTYQLTRLRQLVGRLRELLGLLGAPDDTARLARAVQLMKVLAEGEQSRQRVFGFIAANVSLVARNITDHASRHGEHYIAEHRADWWAMARSAGGGGIVIAVMAMIKIRLTLLHLPPLTEGIAFGLNYGLGFVLIHLLGFTVATKQPAMTAASIAATLEEARPRDLDRLADLAQNVARTQFVAVLGNVGLALPVACLIALAWPYLAGAALAPAPKALHMLHEVHPFESGALLFAAVAGVGLFLSGLVSGFFDNQARYHRLAERLAAAPFLARLGPARAGRWSRAIDEHYGAVLGNLFFGFYLGLMGAVGTLTGLPVDIRHVAFSSANLGTALVTLPASELAPLLPWAAAGVLGIALVNLAVSFTLALHVAMQSRRLGPTQLLRLGELVLRRFARRPFAFFVPPPRRSA